MQQLVGVRHSRSHTADRTHAIILFALIGLSVACGGGGSGVEPNPVPTILASGSATPSNLLEGDTTILQADCNASAGPAPSCTLTYNGIAIGTGIGAARATIAPLGANMGVVAQQGAYSGTAAIAYTLRPLTVAATPSTAVTAKGTSVQFLIAATAGADSSGVQLSDGRILRQLGAAGTLTARFANPGVYTATPVAWNGAVQKAGSPKSITVNETYAIHLLTAPFGSAPIGRVTVIVGTDTIIVPSDTTIVRMAGVYSLGVSLTQAGAFPFGEMTVGTSWYPIASNLNTHSISLDADKVASINIVSTSEGYITGSNRLVHDHEWVNSGSGFYQPAKIKNWEVWILEAGFGTSCAPIDSASKVGAIGSVALMNNDGQGRRIFTYMPGDPIAAGKLTTSPVFRMTPGVVLMCRAFPTQQSNATIYDGQGFMVGSIVRSGGNDTGWYAEENSLLDEVIDGAEVSSPLDVLTRNSTTGAGGDLFGNRSPLDVLIMNGPLRVAELAAQNNFGPLKAIGR